MKSAPFVALCAVLATSSAIPVEGVDGGLVVQGGNADTRFGMFFNPIKNVLKVAAEEDSATEPTTSDLEEDSDDKDAPKPTESGTIVTEVLIEPPVREQEIIIVETMPTAPELILPGLLNILSPQRISPPSPIDQALEVVEEVLGHIRHAGFTEELPLNTIGVDYDRATGPPSGLPDLLSMLEPMIEPTLPKMNAVEAMMIEVI
ncbi:hypothetical protein TWF718_000359 [Orbilia javanica]|uniref:Uncharacterized protein n=1 Tax=Orbilia javanica TaxID=47235 RepID=A0AAN8NF65_9PEZI